MDSSILRKVDRHLLQSSTVQSQCIPKALMKGDILCQARSGMGKTCVFVISILHYIKHTDAVPIIQSIHL